MKWFALITALLFVVCAAVQYNDPDPFIWIIIYLGAAAVSILYTKSLLPYYAYLAFAVAAFIGTVALWPPQFEGILFSEIQTMRNMNIELARESLGLSIMGVVMILLGIGAKTKTSSN